MIRIYELEKMSSEEYERILKRACSEIGDVKEKVLEIIQNVKENGDESLFEYTKKFDGVSLKNFKVSEKEFEEAFESIDPKTLASIKEQIRLSRRFAEEQKKRIDLEWKFENIKGVTVGQRITPIESVGLYVPGGRAPYPTVMQILGVPAKIAGVKKVIACTPPNKDGSLKPELLVAAKLAGVDEVYKMGGAQAIAAFSFGTESIPKVLKIIGPGNVYVTAAKLLCFGEIGIDMPAGPSEAIILADDSANPAWVAADILARAEHDPNAAGVLVTDSMELAKAAKKEVEKQMSSLSRIETIKDSLQKYSAIIVTKNMEEAIKYINKYATEHLEVQVKYPWKTLKKIENAGSIFLGNYAPVAVGDYASGTNHVLPTGQYAKMFSPVGVETFMKTSEIQYLTKEGLKTLNERIIKKLAVVEGFDAHAKSVSIRFQKPQT